MQDIFKYNSVKVSGDARFFFFKVDIFIVLFNLQAFLSLFNETCL